MSMVDGAMCNVNQQKKHLESGVFVQKLDGSYEVTVPARTLTSVLDEVEGLDEIHLFSLDVEGYELEVLKGLNLDKYRPNYILVEARFFDEINDFLTRHSYYFVEKITGHDYLYSSTKK